MLTYFRMPIKLKTGPLYTVMLSNWIMVTVMGNGNSLSTSLPMTLLVDDVTYQQMHSATMVITWRFDGTPMLVDGLICL